MSTEPPEPLSSAEQAAMDVWIRGSADTTGMLCAVRAAVRRVEQDRDTLHASHEAALAERDTAQREAALLARQRDAVLAICETWGALDVVDEIRGAYGRLESRCPVVTRKSTSEGQHG